MPQSPQLAGLSAGQASTSNEICRLASVLAGAFGTDIVYNHRHAVEKDLMRVDLGVNDTPVTLFMSRKTAARVAQTYFDLGADYEIPDSLRAAALEASAEGVLEKIEQAANIRIAVLGVADSGVSAEDRPLLSFRLSAGANTQAIIYLAANDGIDFSAAPPALPRNVDDTVLRLPLVVGDSSVSLADFAGLARGDVILVPDPGLIEKSMVRLPISGGRAIVAAIGNNKVTVKMLGQVMTNESDNMGAEPSGPDENVSAEPAEGAQGEPLLAPEAIDDVPIRLDFDLGEVELTVGELRTLVAGHCFDLAKLPEKAVGIRVNGRRIGAGEIVEIDGRLGVRITELAGGS